MESHVHILPLPTPQGLLSNALSPLARPCLQRPWHPSQSFLFNLQFKCTSARKTVSICPLIGHLRKTFHVHRGSSTEIMGIPGRGAGVPYSAQKMCHGTADAEGNSFPLFSAALLSVHFCPCLHTNSSSPFVHFLTNLIAVFLFLCLPPKQLQQSHRRCPCF